MGISTIAEPLKEGSAIWLLGDPRCLQGIGASTRLTTPNLSVGMREPLGN